MTWAEVAGRLESARTYWLDTTMPSGAPHAAPVWGAVVDDILHLYTERGTVKARNIAVSPRVLVHLESGEDVLIVHGLAEDLGPPSAIPRVVAALAAKYTRPADRQYLPDVDPDFDVVYAIRATAAVAWQLADYTGSQRRWTRLVHGPLGPLIAGLVGHDGSKFRQPVLSRQRPRTLGDCPMLQRTP